MKATKTRALIMAPFRLFAGWGIVPSMGCSLKAIVRPADPEISQCIFSSTRRKGNRAFPLFPGKRYGILRWAIWVLPISP
jgi:hypothetical protein